jgi:hypothetical protein
MIGGGGGGDAVMRLLQADPDPNFSTSFSTIWSALYIWLSLTENVQI